MTTIADLHKSISELSSEESFSLIRELRALRRELKPVKEIKTKAKGSTTSKPKQKQLSLDELVKTMSPEQVAGLISKLKKG